MKLESQVCSLEYSKQLNKLDIKQKSLFWWKYWIPRKGSTYIHPGWKLSLYKGSMDDYELISAFTLTELGDLFPCEFSSGKDSDVNYFCTVLLPNNNELTCYEDTETNARAKMVVHLIQEGYIKVWN